MKQGVYRLEQGKEKYRDTREAFEKAKQESLQ